MRAFFFGLILLNLGQSVRVLSTSNFRKAILRECLDKTVKNFCGAPINIKSQAAVISRFKRLDEGEYFLMFTGPAGNDWEREMGLRRQNQELCSTKGIASIAGNSAPLFDPQLGWGCGPGIRITSLKGAEHWSEQFVCQSPSMRSDIRCNFVKLLDRPVYSFVPKGYSIKERFVNYFLKEDKKFFDAKKAEELIRALNDSTEDGPIEMPYYYRATDEDGHVTVSLIRMFFHGSSRELAMVSNCEIVRLDGDGDGLFELPEVISEIAKIKD